jgi:hypothetical protein
MMLIQQQEKLGSCGRRSGIHNDGTTNGTVLVRSGKWLDPNEALPQKGAGGDVLSEAQVIDGASTGSHSSTASFSQRCSPKRGTMRWRCSRQRAATGRTP